MAKNPPPPAPPTSACFNSPTICSTENRFRLYELLFIDPLLEPDGESFPDSGCPRFPQFAALGYDLSFTEATPA